MHDLLEVETTTGLTKELGDASTGAPLFSQCGGYRGRGQAQGRGRGGRGGHGGCGGSGGSGGSGDSHESKCTYCKSTAILQMHAESGNMLRREETMEETTSAFATSAGSQVMSKSIACPTNI